MTCGTNKSMKLCPLSLGIAVGLTLGLGAFFILLWIMYRNQSAIDFTFYDILIRALTALIQGFLFGFFTALFYDLCICCRNKLYKKSSSTCGCGCTNCTCCATDNTKMTPKI